MIRSCNIAIYYRRIIYSSIKDVLFGQYTVARETMMLASELKSDLVNKLKDSAADGKTKSRAQVGRVGSGPEFHINCGSGRVGSLHLWVGLVPVEKIGPTSNSESRRICEWA